MGAILVLLSGACGDGDGPADVNAPPSVTITAPADGAVVTEGESVMLTGTASDPEDGDLTASIAWSSDLDGALGTGGSVTATLSVGTHTITASVTDARSQTATASITVEVQADQPPSVTITAPADGTVLTEGESVMLTGTASDPEDGDLTGSIAWTSDRDGALGTGGSVTATLSVGTHTITASVTDARSQTATASITVEVQADQPPSVTITEPADGAVVTEGESVMLTGTASDPEDGDLTGSIAWSSDRDGALGTGGSVTATLSVGIHTITASVTDARSQTATASITVEVRQATALVSGFLHSGTIGEAGEEDAWTFDASAGDGVVLSVGDVQDLSGFSPWIRVIAPSSTLEAEDQGSAQAEVSFNVVESGTYTVLVASGSATTPITGNSGTGDYQVSFVRVPGSLTIAPGDEGGSLAPGTTVAGALAIGDLDTWSFTGSAGDYAAAYAIDTGSDPTFRPWLRVLGPSGLLQIEDWDPSQADLGLLLPETGTYTVVLGSGHAGSSGPIQGDGGAGVYSLTFELTTSPMTAKYRPLAVYHNLSCALTTTGAPYCWGRGGYGAVDTPTPEPLGGAPAVSELAAGYFHLCGLDATREAFCVGYNNWGQLGSITASNIETTPVPVAATHPYVHIASGNYHSCALDPSGAAFCWGYNAYGQLGNTTSPQKTPEPIRVEGGRRFIQLTAGRYHTCGIESSGAAYCWGYDQNGQLGRGTAGGTVFMPTPVTGGITFVQIAAGDFYTCAVDNGGAGWCWGLNSNGQLGTGVADAQATPVPTPQVVQIDPPIVEIGTGHAHTCAITESLDPTTPGETYCWGWNGYGQLGNLETAHASPTPTIVVGGHAFVDIMGGLQHTCALEASGTVFCWGSNAVGQLGLGVITSSDYLAPQETVPFR